MCQYKHLMGKDEKGIVADRSLDLTPLLSMMEDSYADVLDGEKRDGLLNPAQHRRKRAERVNMITRNKWETQQADNPWRVVDSCYTHLEDDITKMRLELHPADPFTGGLPAPAKTNAAYARYTQNGCLPASRIGWSLGMDGIYHTDLSGVYLIAVWAYIEGRIVITLYKPIEARKRKSCIEMPLRGDRVEQSKIQYKAAEENGLLLPGLIDDEQNVTDENDHKDKIGRRKDDPLA